MKYIIKRGADPSALSEATREELLVLCAVAISEGGLDGESAAKSAGVSRARAVSALALWEEAGAIEKAESSEGEGAKVCRFGEACHSVIEEEFEERLQPYGIYEEESVKVAETIREEGLSELISECASLMTKPALTTQEVKIITGVYTQYALSVEYLLTLAAYLASIGKLTAPRLRDKAISLVGKSIDTTEALEVYIEDMEKASGDEQEIRRVLGIWSRKITDQERESFKKWTNDFGYSTVIIGEAYSICVLNTGRLSISYMDKVLSSWHAKGLSTLEECRAANAVFKAEAEKPNPTRPKAKSKPEKPRYGDFDVNDAFAKALERSYGED